MNIKELTEIRKALELLESVMDKYEIRISLTKIPADLDEVQGVAECPTVDNLSVADLIHLVSTGRLDQVFDDQQSRDAATPSDSVTETDTWYDDDMDEDDSNYTDLDEALETLIPLPEDATPVNPATFDEQWEEYLSNMNPKHHEWMNGWSQKTKETRLRWFLSAKERGVRFINRDQSE